MKAVRITLIASLARQAQAKAIQSPRKRYALPLHRVPEASATKATIRRKRQAGPSLNQRIETRIGKAIISTPYVEYLSLVALLNLVWLLRVFRLSFTQFSGLWYLQKKAITKARYRNGKIARQILSSCCATLNTHLARAPRNFI